MKTCWIKILFFIPLLTCHIANASPSDLETSFREISKEIQCPTCEGTNILESTSELSKTFRDMIRKKLTQGKNREEIIAFFVKRYGKKILLAPPRKGTFKLAWSFPALLLLLWPILVWLYFRENNRPTSTRRSRYHLIKKMALALKHKRGL